MKKLLQKSQVVLMVLMGSCAGFDIIDDINDFTVADVHVTTEFTLGEGTSQNPFQINLGASSSISIWDNRDPEGERTLNQLLRWEVDNSEILEVVNGLITTINPGIAEVRAFKRLENGDDQEFGHWYISTFLFQRIEVTNLNGGTLNVVLGDSTQVMTNYYDSNNTLQRDVEIELFSEDESVLQTRQGGYVAGLASGETSLRVSVANIAEEIETRITVLVEEDLNRPFSVAIENPITNIELGDSLLLIGNAYSFSGREIPEVNLLWTSSDPTVIEIRPNGYARALKVGTANITAALEDGTIVSEVTSFEVQNIFRTRRGNIVSGRGGTTGTVDLFISRQDTLLYVRLNSDFFGARIPGPTLYLSNGEGSVEGGLRIQDIDHGDGENRTFLIPGNPDIDDFNYVIYHCEPFNVVYGSYELEIE